MKRPVATVYTSEFFNGLLEDIKHPKARSNVTSTGKSLINKVSEQPFE